MAQTNKSSGSGSRGTGTQRMGTTRSSSARTASGSRTAGRGQSGSRSQTGRSANSGTGSGRSGSGQTRSGKQSASQRTSSRYDDAQLRMKFEEDDSLRDEIGIILVLLCCILLVLSYLHICGSFGEVVNKAVFGLMGVFGYAFPFALALVSFFAIANKYNRSITAKVIYCSLIMMFISSLLQIAVGGFDKEIKLIDYFSHSVPGYEGTGRTYGGLLGGAICKLLCPYVGKVAAAVIIVAVIIILFLLIAGKAIFTAIARSGIESAEERRAMRLAREEEERIFAEQEAEEERLRRAQLREERRKNTKGNEQTYNDEFPDDLPDDFFEKVAAETGKSKEKKPGFVDQLMRRGMGLEADRIGDTPEYRKMIETYGKTDFDMSEISDANAGADVNTAESTSRAENVKPVADDIVNSEIQKKFGNSSGIEVPRLREHPTVSKTGMTRNIMVDEEEQPETIDINEIRNASKRANADVETEAAEEKPIEKIEEKPEEKPVESSLKNRTGSGATSFTTPEQLAELRVEQEKKQEPPYVFPPLNLLKKGQPVAKSASGGNELKNTVDKLQKTFESFGVGVTVTDATIGPTVTRYELLPDQGVKVKTITSLGDDIKLALAAAEIRIEAPIPGKAAVGIEVPNATTSPVLLRDLLEAAEFRDAQSNLTFAVGKDIGGKTICFDIASMPHMLIAGATGSGKSVCINSLILSIIYKAKPSDVRLIMIDPKRVELVGYNGIPHLLVPVVTDVKKATGALNWAIAEMDDRYERFANAGVNNLASYNRLMEEKYYEEGNEGECPDRLPQILIIVDELNDLMMTANSKEVEASICRLTQLARASGIHVVLATQRPSVNVITGTIKANIPSRIAFSVSSIVDSRTIIDQAGAEKLLGKGDMLFYPQGYPKPVRLQGAYVSDKEIAAVVDFIKSKCKEVRYSDRVSQHIERSVAGGGKSSSGQGLGSFGAAPEDNGDDHDEFFEQAGRFIIEKQKASIGMLQRVYKIGFNRAARIMDQLAEEGIVGPEEGTKPRRILMTLPQFEAYLAGTGGTENQSADEADSEEEPDGVF